MAPFNSGFLDAFLGISSSPSNPIGAYLPDPASPSATGFSVFEADLGTETLHGFPRGFAGQSARGVALETERPPRGGLSEVRSDYF
jgi:hypothetical protein